MAVNHFVSLPRHNGVYCHFWQDEAVVYHESSAQTHLLDGLGAEIFKNLSKQATAHSDLIQQLQNVFEWPADLDLATAVDHLLAEYQTLGLLEIRDKPSA
jgi:PqqD family protein of HPr-rel-A system